MRIVLAALVAVGVMAAACGSDTDNVSEEAILAYPVAYHDRDAVAVEVAFTDDAVIEDYYEVTVIDRETLVANSLDDWTTDSEGEVVFTWEIVSVDGNNVVVLAESGTGREFCHELKFEGDQISFWGFGTLSMGDDC